MLCLGSVAGSLSRHLIPQLYRSCTERIALAVAPDPLLRRQARRHRLVGWSGLLPSLASRFCTAFGNILFPSVPKFRDEPLQSDNLFGTLAVTARIPQDRASGSFPSYRQFAKWRPDSWVLSAKAIFQQRAELGAFLGESDWSAFSARHVCFPMDRFQACRCPSGIRFQQPLIPRHFPDP